MLDPKKYANISGIKVGQLRQLLSNYNQDARVNVTGDDYAYIHAEKDGSCISFDNAQLEDIYESESSEKEFNKMDFDKK